MQFKKVVSVIIGLAVIVFGVFALLKAAKDPKINQLRTDLKDKTAIFFDNLREDISPQRRHPLTTIELEESLKVSLPVPFAEFNQEDWNWFWELLYGRFTVDSNGWPKRKRQSTRQEIQNILIDYYYRPFSSFRQRQWDIFWQRILRGKVFKRQE